MQCMSCKKFFICFMTLHFATVKKKITFVRQAFV